MIFKIKQINNENDEKNREDKNKNKDIYIKDNKITNIINLEEKIQKKIKILLLISTRKIKKIQVIFFNHFCKNL